MKLTPEDFRSDLSDEELESLRVEYDNENPKTGSLTIRLTSANAPFLLGLEPNDVIRLDGQRYRIFRVTITAGRDAEEIQFNLETVSPHEPEDPMESVFVIR